ncbi:hypothetical protein PIB30_035444 [Stylosanthes scabra]|uniref:CCHC-type domain-containing protein n=1 Tax=Stylosanthes scabra TaxID=79078 RepID=A0ABU6TE68_9FABA|nr:hypothetical protein [Stylosanthes scabra]
MESFGIPCVHLVGVLVYLDRMKIPQSLILDRWTKKAKQTPIKEVSRTGEIPDAAYMSMHAAMLEDCRELVKLSCKYFEDYYDVKKRQANERDVLLDRHRQRFKDGEHVSGGGASVRNPARARHKGCGRAAINVRGKFRRIQRCRKCGRAGHNARKCSYVRNDDHIEYSSDIGAEVDRVGQSEWEEMEEGGVGTSVGFV